MDNKASLIKFHLSPFRLAARAVATCWTAFWVWFIGVNIVSGLSEPFKQDSYEGYAFATIFLIIVVFPTVLAWKKEKIGGIVLVVEGVCIAIIYLNFLPRHVTLLDALETAPLLSFPPIFAGVLFLRSWRNSQPRETS